MQPKPKISVQIICYNQAAFIAQTLDGVLMQKVPFDYEIVIGDDCSTDGTVDIIKKYERRWPGKIRPIFRARNVGMGKNARESLEQCRGEYIACVEGDDYWTDSRKLHRQAEFLDRHQNCALVHHRVEHVSWPEGRQLREFPAARYRKERISPTELALGNFIQTCSIMFRRNCMPTLDAGFEELALGDWPLCVMITQAGWIGYLDHPMACYRIHGKSSWSSRPAEYRLKAMETMARYLVQRLEGNAREAWKDTVLAFALKDFALTLRSFSLSRAAAKLIRFGRCSAELNRPFWLLTRLWAYWNANLCK